MTRDRSVADRQLPSNQLREAAVAGWVPSTAATKFAPFRFPYRNVGSFRNGGIVCRRRVVTKQARIDLSRRLVGCAFHSRWPSGKPQLRACISMSLGSMRKKLTASKAASDFRTRNMTKQSVAPVWILTTLAISRACSCQSAASK